MACETKTKVIDDIEISVTQWPAEKAFLIKLRLAEIFGKAFARLAEEGLSDAKTNDAMALSDSIGVLFENNPPEKIFKLIKECIIGVGYDGRRITESGINELFSGDNLIQIYKIFIFVVQVNYANLIKGQKAEGFLAGLKVNL